MTVGLFPFQPQAVSPSRLQLSSNFIRRYLLTIHPFTPSLRECVKTRIVKSHKVSGGKPPDLRDFLTLPYPLDLKALKL